MKKLICTINSTGCILLCQALITSAIYENDRSFFTTELGEIAKMIAVMKNNYNISAIINKATHLPYCNSKKYDTNTLKKEVLIYSVDELADRYKTSSKSIRTALSKRKIPYGKKCKALSLEKRVMTMTPQMITDKYHTSEKDIKSTLSRRKIRWNGMTSNKSCYRMVENGQLEFVF